MTEDGAPRKRRLGWLVWPSLLAAVVAGLYLSRDRLAQLTKGEPGRALIPALFQPYVEEVGGSYFAGRLGPKSLGFSPVTFARDAYGSLPSSFDHSAHILSGEPSQGRLPFRCRLELGSPARLRRVVLVLHVLSYGQDQPSPSQAEIWSQAPELMEEKALPKDGRPYSLTWGKTLEFKDRPEGQRTLIVVSYMLVDHEGAVFIGGLEDEF